MEDRTTAEHALLRCMAAVAAADGRVDDSELAEISEIYDKLVGRPVPVNRLRAEVDAAWSGRVDPVDFVGGVGRDADLETRGLIAVASYRVLTVDGEITAPEASIFNGIVERLGLTRKEVLDLLAD